MNTDTVVIKSTAMKHIEGGWPKEVDPTEKQDVTRFVTKAQKQQEYKDALLTMGPVIARCMKQNGTCDIYEGYFDDVEEDHSSTPPSAKVRRWPMLATARSTTLRGTGHRALWSGSGGRRSRSQPPLSAPCSVVRVLMSPSLSPVRSRVDSLRTARAPPLSPMLSLSLCTRASLCLFRRPLSLCAPSFVYFDVLSRAPDFRCGGSASLWR